MLLDGQLSWRKCPVAVCLAAWILLGLWQLTPLPRGLLSRISPVTARMYDRLLPAQPEVLPFGEPRGVSMPPAGSTLSFYPGATRRELARYLAILLLFAVVRNNIASSASLRRLGIAAFVNGSLLALFGLVQAFSADPETIYWSYPAPGATGVFGPFINRNHFAFHMNVCVGLGAGLLLSRYAGRGRMQGAAGPSPAAALADRAATSAQDRYSSAARSGGPGDDLRPGADDQQHGLFPVPRWIPGAPGRFDPRPGDPAAPIAVVNPGEDRPPDPGDRGGLGVLVRLRPGRDAAGDLPGRSDESRRAPRHLVPGLTPGEGFPLVGVRVTAPINLSTSCTAAMPTTPT